MGGVGIRLDNYWPRFGRNELQNPINFLVFNTAFILQGECQIFVIKWLYFYRSSPKLQPEINEIKAISVLVP